MKNIRQLQDYTKCINTKLEFHCSFLLFKWQIKFHTHIQLVEL